MSTPKRPKRRSKLPKRPKPRSKSPKRPMTPPPHPFDVLFEYSSEQAAPEGYENYEKPSFKKSKKKSIKKSKRKYQSRRR